MIRIQFSIEGPDFERARKKDMLDARADATEAALAWLMKRMPKRFSGELARQLGWAERSKRTKQIKEAIRPGTGRIAAKFTGKTERMALGGMKADVKRGLRSTSYLRIPVPAEVARRPRKRKGGGASVNVKEELGRVTKNEVEVMSKIYASTFAKKLGEYMARGPKRRTRG